MPILRWCADAAVRGMLLRLRHRHWVARVHRRRPRRRRGSPPTARRAPIASFGPWITRPATTERSTCRSRELTDLGRGCCLGETSVSAPKISRSRERAPRLACRRSRRTTSGTGGSRCCTWAAFRGRGSASTSGSATSPRPRTRTATCSPMSGSSTTLRSRPNWVRTHGAYPGRRKPVVCRVGSAPVGGIAEPGRLAQPVEHLLYTQGVGGSIPSPPMLLAQGRGSAGAEPRPREDPGKGRIAAHRLGQRGQLILATKGHVGPARTGTRRASGSDRAARAASPSADARGRVAWGCGQALPPARAPACPDGVSRTPRSRRAVSRPASTPANRAGGGRS